MRPMSQPAIGVIGNIAGTQRKGYSPSLQMRSSSLQLASSPVITSQQSQGICAKTIAHFSNQVNIYVRTGANMSS